jgi:site-specific DNA recombinase
MRVSSEDQAERETIHAQRDFLRGFARLYQYTVIDEYADEGFSGALSLGERPAGRRLLEDARSGRFGCVLVYRVTRLGRSLRALLDAHHILSDAGVTLRSATEPFDTSTPFGTFMFQFLGSLAELDKANIIEQLTLGRDRVAKEGKWTGGPIPLGYDLDEHGRLIHNTCYIPEAGLSEEDLVRDLFHRIAQGSTTYAECARLNALGIPTGRRYSSGRVTPGKRGWVPERVRYVLRNPIYIGRHVVRSQHGTIQRPVPALIDTGLWEQAQQRLSANRRRPKGNETRTYLLRGLITCGLCGHRYTGTFHHQTHKTPYYRCNKRVWGKREHCPSKLLNAQWIEDLVWKDCRQFILNPGGALVEAQRQLRTRLDQSASLAGESQRLQRQLLEKDIERDRIMTLFRRGRITIQEVETHLDLITQEAGELRTMLSGLQAQQDLAQAFEAHLSEATSLLTTLQSRLENIERTNDMETKRLVIELLVAGIRVETSSAGQKKHAAVTITYKFADTRVAKAKMPAPSC